MCYLFCIHNSVSIWFEDASMSCSWAQNVQQPSMVKTALDFPRGTVQAAHHLVGIPRPQAAALEFIWILQETACDKFYLYYCNMFSFVGDINLSFVSSPVSAGNVSTIMEWQQWDATNTRLKDNIHKYNEAYQKYTADRSMF